MVRKYETIMVRDFLKDEKVVTVHEDDYLKVVDENEKLKIEQDNGIKEICKLNKELLKQDNLLKEKDEDISELREELEFLKGNSEILFKLTRFISEERSCYGRAGELSVDIAIDTIKRLEKQLQDKDEEINKNKNDLKTLSNIYNGQRLVIKELNKKIIELELGLKEEVIETYTLSYSYLGVDGVTIKNYRQSGLLKEEYEEMYGMDSDNWLSHSLVKDRKEVE